MKNLWFNYSIEKALGFAVGFSSYSNKREFTLLFLCFSFSLGFKLKPKSNQFIPNSTKESLDRLRLSIGLLTIIGLLNTTMIVLTELSSDIPNVLNAFWGMLMMFIVIFYYLDIRAYKKLKRSIV